MTLRTRLTAAFLAVVLGPVLLGAVFVGYTVSAVGQDRSTHQLDLAASAVRSAVAAICQQLYTVGELLAQQSPATRDEFAAELVAQNLVAGVRLAEPDGTAVPGPDGDTRLLTEAAPPQPWLECGAPPAAPAAYPAIAARVAVPADTEAPEAGAGAAELWVAVRLDQRLVDRLAAAAGVSVTLLGAGPEDAVFTTDDTVSSSLVAAAALADGEVAETADRKWVRRLEPAADQPLPLLLTSPPVQPAGLYPTLSAVVVIAAVLAVLAAWRLGRATTRPLAELAHAAERVAEGDLSVRVPVRDSDEAGRLAATFNRMTHRTQAYVQALTASRDQLRRQLAVLGETLSSTHDLDRILQVILQTAQSATAAGAGAVLLVDEEAGTLGGHASRSPGHGADPAQRPGLIPVTVPLGQGLLGEVAASGEARRGRVLADGPALHPAEPRCRTYVVVPVSAPTGMALRRAPWPAPPAVRGVLALYDRLGGEEFDDTDLFTLRTFAGQAGVAVDNVHAHQEAQRLSLTDPLTGLWNYRSLRGSIRREVERASRFDHRLAVLALDLDRFKEVNDGYGHPAGDEVLAEFASRIRLEIREVDLAFRQGGEEFVILLPETDTRGATVLANRLGSVVRDTPVEVTPRGAGHKLSLRITVSIGIAVYPDHALTPEALLDAADDALYAAKAAGRDTYRVALRRPGDAAVSTDTTELPVLPPARAAEDDLPRAGRVRTGGDPAPGGAQPPPPRRGR